MYVELGESYYFGKNPLMKYPVLFAGVILLKAFPVDAGPRLSEAFLRFDAPSTGDSSHFHALLRLSESWIQKNIDSCGFYAQTAREIAVADHDRHEEADAISTLGDFYRLKTDYSTATQYYEQASGIYDSLRDRSSEAACLASLAQLYKDIAGIKQTNKLLDQGVQYARSAYSLYETARDTVGMMEALNEMGIIFRDKGKAPRDSFYYDTAYAQFLKAVRLHDLSGKGNRFVARLFNNISQIYSEYKHDPRGALGYLRKAEAINLAAGSQSSLTYNYNNFAQVYAQLGLVDSSLLYARKMLALCLRLRLPNRTYDAYDQLYHSFDAARRPDSALHYYILASVLSDSMVNLAKTKEVLDLQAKYMSMKREMDIQKLNAEGLVKNREIFFLLVLSVFLVVVVVGFSYLIHRLRAQKKQIGIQSEKLEVMLRELHHRVKNNLQIVSSLLGLQRYRSGDPETAGVLLESQQRVQAMSLIHQRLYRTDLLSSVNIREYLIDLTESLLSSYGYDRDSFDLSIDICTDIMDIDAALPIGLIVNELVTNAFKYAYKGVGRPALRVALEQDSRGIVLVVRDNGVGCDEGRWTCGKESFGRQLIGALCKQLRATQEMEAGEGTVFTIRIPKAA